MEWCLIHSVLLVTMATSTIANKDCGLHGNCYNVGEITLDVDIDDETITLNWGINSTDQIYGFKVIIELSEDDIIYESPLLNKNEKSMIITSALDSEDATVCVLVLLNMTEVIAKKCDDIKISNLQMYVGILAGIVFLIPCMAALSYIIYKDRQISKAPSHDPSEVSVLIKSQEGIEAVPDENMISKQSTESKGKVNRSFQFETSVDMANIDTELVFEAELSSKDPNTREKMESAIINQTTDDKKDGTKQTGVYGVKPQTKESIFVIRL